MPTKETNTATTNVMQQDKDEEVEVKRIDEESGAGTLEMDGL